jgi:hypothetical protein
MKKNQNICVQSVGCSDDGDDAPGRGRAAGRAKGNFGPAHAPVELPTPSAQASFASKVSGLQAIIWNSAGRCIPFAGDGVQTSKQLFFEKKILRNRFLSKKRLVFFAGLFYMNNVSISKIKIIINNLVKFSFDQYTCREKTNNSSEHA